MFFFLLIMVIFFYFLRGVYCFYIFEWLFFSLKFNFYFNSLVFSFILLFVSLSVLVFRSYYLNGELNFRYYFIVLVIFIFRIFSLNFSYSSVTILLRWDLLGISRFFLVLFYNNWDSCRGSINTVLTNRLGDFFIFVFFRSSIFRGISFLRFSFFFWFSRFFLVLTAFTKRAQFPFSGWLPKAIRAPTPVRSLVHRSTLVTAGLLLIFNFSLMLINSYIISYIFFSGLFTTIFSSLRAVIEEDLKKVVALRTLSQMGFSIITFGLGISFISLLHLLSHALFKSCLFIQVGYLIHCSFGQQDGRFYGFLYFIPNFIQIQLLITLFCLCGLFFTRGLVRKDLILEFFFFNRNYFFICLLFFVTVYLTFFYSYRLWKGLFINFSNFFTHYRRRVLINYLRVFLCLNSIFFIWWFNFNLSYIPSFFVFIDFYTPLIYLFIFFFVMFFFVKFLVVDFTYKFLGDYLPKLGTYKMFSLKFFENFLYNLSLRIVRFFINIRGYFNFYNYRSFFNSIVLIIFIIFVLIWGLILYKIFSLHLKECLLYINLYFNLKYNVWDIKI